MEHSHDALALFNKGLGKHKPRKIMLHGNHEDRIDRFVDENPELDGTLKISDLQFKKYGWQEVPYKTNESCRWHTLCTPLSIWYYGISYIW